MTDARLPDGTILRFPDGTLPTVIDEAVKRYVATGSQERPSQWPILGGFTDALIQGPFGLSDEVGAAGAATGRWLKGLTSGKPVNWQDAYDEALTAQRALQAEYANRHPYLSGVATLLGGLGGVGPGAAAAAPMTMWQSVGQAAKTGAAYGAVTGFGSSEGGLGNRLVGAAGGAALGGAMGGVAPPLTYAAAKAAPVVKSVLGLRDAGTAAEQQILRALERDGMTPQDAAAKYNEWQAAGAKPEMLMDLGGENVRGLARAAAGVPGASKNTAAEKLTERQAGQGGRIISDAGIQLGGGRDYDRVAEQLVADRAAASKPAYERAGVPSDPNRYGSAPTVDTPEVTRLLAKSSDVQAAVARAKRLPNYADLPDNSMVLLDKAYKLIGGEANAAHVAGNDAAARDLKDLRSQLLDGITGGDQNHPYRAALHAYSGPSDSLDAMTVGQNILRASTGETRRAVGQMGDGDKEFFKLGVLRAIEDKVGNTPDAGDATKKILGTSLLRQRLRAGFDSDAAFDRFAALAKREASMFSNAFMVRGGSQTAPRLAETEDMAVDPSLLLNLAGGNLGEAGKKAVGTILRRSQSMNPATADALAKRLFADPETTKSVLAALVSRHLQNQASTAGARAAGRSALRVGGIGTGFLSSQTEAQ